MERPILFSTEMVQAILAGRKTMTRRIVKAPFQNWMNTADNPDWFKSIITQCNYGQIGDILWVRETWAKVSTFPEPDIFGKYLYKSMGDTAEKWKPSIFMPKDACRIKLRIINIRIERLHDISENDVVSEGINDNPDGANPFRIFLNLWEKINGKGSSELNPWVWVIEFKRI